MATDWERSFCCEDIAGRPQKGSVAIRDEELVVTVPAPGTAVFRWSDVDQAEELRAAMAEAIEAWRTLRGRRS